LAPSKAQLGGSPNEIAALRASYATIEVPEKTNKMRLKVRFPNLMQN